jgi:phosphoribosylformimino-5-aminoimidazole carboxamide ribotide isomerase
MILIPALDIFAGRIVRLEKGDFSKVSYFRDNPEVRIQGLRHEGAKLIHLVDLSGARNPAERQSALITRLARKFPGMLQIGGGIRTWNDLASLIMAGAERVVIGSLAIEQPSVVKEALAEFGSNRICLALDVKMDDGQYHVMTRGWLHNSRHSLEQAVAAWSSLGIQHFLCTDISRDGMMRGPSLALYRHLVSLFPQISLQASGGVANLEDLKQLRDEGVAAAIVGRSLLMGKIDIKEALSLC